MNILIVGASGFIGSELVKALQINHKITVLGRTLTTLEKKFSADIAKVTWHNLPQLDATQFTTVINLCGYNIAQSRWTHAVKQKIIDSRVNANTTLINWLISQHAKPHFICANAIGIYGAQEPGSALSIDETSPIDFEHPHDFLSQIGIAWQQSLNPAIDYGISVTTTRFGVVLKKNAGMLKKIQLSFYCGLGSVLGDGRQIISWVHIQDVIETMTYLLSNPQLSGAFNITAPNPVSQSDFARLLAKTIKRPIFLTIPSLAIKILLGEMGDYLLLKGQRVLPKRLQELGYSFKYPNLAQALQQEYV